MHLIHTDCEVKYSGRCESYLEKSPRLVMVKSDGSLSVHVDEKYKPLNYMTKTEVLNKYEEDGKTILYAANENEELTIIMHEIIKEIDLDFPVNEIKMKKEGTEPLLQKHLYEHIDDYYSDTTSVCREFGTGKGSIDLLCYNEKEDQALLIEVKRTARKDAVYQVMRYNEGIESMIKQNKANDEFIVRTKKCGNYEGKEMQLPLTAFENRRMILAAKKVHPGAYEEALEHGIEILEL